MNRAHILLLADENQKDEAIAAGLHTTRRPPDGHPTGGQSGRCNC